MKISESTTMAELAAEKARLGCAHLTLSVDRYGEGRHASVQHPRFGTYFGDGATDAEAVDNAFQWLRQEIAKASHDR